jgi:hypothetical protein
VTHAEVAGSHTGAAGGQSVDNTQPTHRDTAESQRGLAPLQSAEPRHSTQRPEGFSQNFRAAGQSPLLKHSEQKPSSPQRGALAGQGALSAQRGMHLRVRGSHVALKPQS